MKFNAKIKTKGFVSSLKKLERQGRPIQAKALSKTAFDVRDDLRRHIRSRLDFASPSTSKFVSEGVRASPAKPNKLVARVFTLKKSTAFIAPLLKPEQRTEKTGANLTAGKQIAIPVGISKNKRGKVPKRLTPGALLDQTGGGATGFVVRDEFIFRRTGRGKSKAVKLAFVLKDKIKVPEKLAFFETAEKSAKLRMPQQVKKALARLLK
jgi:hypothetical protein